MHIHKDTSSKRGKLAASESVHKMSAAMPMHKNTSSRKAGKSKRHSQPKTSTHPAISTELIRCRAYQNFLARNGQGGDAVSDWLQAERHLHDVRPESIRDGLLD